MYSNISAPAHVGPRSLSSHDGSVHPPSEMCGFFWPMSLQIHPQTSPIPIRCHIQSFGTQAQLKNTLNPLSAYKLQCFGDVESLYI